MAWTNTGRAFESFDAQFEPDADGFLYRRSMKSAPIRVSAEERDRFSRDYRRSFRRLTWGFSGGIMLLLAAILTPMIMAGSEPNHLVLYPLLIGAMIPLLLLQRHIWNAPARELQGRTAIGRERSRGEVRSLMLRRMGWGRLAGTLLVVPFLLLKVSVGFDIWHGWGRLWLLFAGIVAIALAFQAIRKWQISAGGD